MRMMHTSPSKFSSMSTKQSQNEHDIRSSTARSTPEKKLVPYTTGTVALPHGKPQKTLGKGFTECNTRQTAHVIYSVNKQLFAECFLSRTRQMVCRVSNLTLTKIISLPSVFQNTLGKPIFFLKIIIQTARKSTLWMQINNHSAV